MTHKEFKTQVSLLSTPEDFKNNKHILKEVTPLEYDPFIAALKLGATIENAKPASKIAGRILRQTALSLDEIIHLSNGLRLFDSFILNKPETPAPSEKPNTVTLTLDDYKEMAAELEEFKIFQKSKAVWSVTDFLTGKVLYTDDAAIFELGKQTESYLRRIHDLKKQLKTLKDSRPWYRKIFNPKS